MKKEMLFMLLLTSGAITATANGTIKLNIENKINKKTEDFMIVDNTQNKEIESLLKKFNQENMSQYGNKRNKKETDENLPAIIISEKDMIALDKNDEFIFTVNVFDENLPELEMEGFAKEGNIFLKKISEESYEISYKAGSIKDEEIKIKAKDDAGQVTELIIPIKIV